MLISEEYFREIEEREIRRKQEFILTGIPVMKRAEYESYHGDVEAIKRAEQESLERAERESLERAKLERAKLERAKRIEKILGGYK